MGKISSPVPHTEIEDYSFLSPFPYGNSDLLFPIKQRRKTLRTDRDTVTPCDNA